MHLLSYLENHSAFPKVKSVLGLSQYHTLTLLQNNINNNNNIKNSTFTVIYYTVLNAKWIVLFNGVISSV